MKKTFDNIGGLALLLIFGLPLIAITAIVAHYQIYREHKELQ